MHLQLFSVLYRAVCLQLQAPMAQQCTGVGCHCSMANRCTCNQRTQYRWGSCFLSQQESWWLVSL